MGKKTNKDVAEDIKRILELSYGEGDDNTNRNNRYTLKKSVGRITQNQFRKCYYLGELLNRLITGGIDDETRINREEFVEIVNEALGYDRDGEPTKVNEFLEGYDLCVGLVKEHEDFQNLARIKSYKDLNEQCQFSRNQYVIIQELLETRDVPISRSILKEKLKCSDFSPSEKTVVCLIARMRKSGMAIGSKWGPKGGYRFSNPDFMKATFDACNNITRESPDVLRNIEWKTG